MTTPPPPPPLESTPLPQPAGEPQASVKQKNTVGLIALIIGIVGFIFACIPGALIVGWILLPIALILGIVGVAQSGKKKGASIAAIIIAIVGTIVAVIVFLSVVAGAVDDAFGEDDLSVDEATSPESAQTDEDANAEEPDNAAEADEASADGTRGNPLQVGDAVSNDDWTVVLGDPYEAGEAVTQENEFNDPPEDGMEFWIAPVEATYVGEDSGYPAMDIDVKFVGDDGHTYNTYDPGCGVIPDDLFNVDEIYPDTTAEGNVCVSVPEGAPGLWTVASGFGDPVFFTAE